MHKGRKTTFEERIEMAQYTIANGLDYQKAIEKYGVSYQQVYAWVRKYQASGEDALAKKLAEIKRRNTHITKTSARFNRSEEIKLSIFVFTLST